MNLKNESISKKVDEIFDSSDFIKSEKINISSTESNLEAESNLEIKEFKMCLREAYRLSRNVKIELG